MPGKSILLDALGLILGERADTDSIQSGADRAEISAGFTIDELPSVGRWLESQDLDDEGGCLLRRVVSSTSASRAFVNGRPVAIGLSSRHSVRSLSACTVNMPIRH